MTILVIENNTAQSNIFSIPDDHVNPIFLQIFAPSHMCFLLVKAKNMILIIHLF